MDLYDLTVRGQALLQRRAALRALLRAWYAGAFPTRQRAQVRRLVARFVLDGLLRGNRHAFFCIYSRASQRRWMRKWLDRWYMEMQVLRFAQMAR